MLDWVLMSNGRDDQDGRGARIVGRQLSRSSATGGCWCERVSKAAGELEEGTHSLAGLGCCPTGSLTYVGSFGVGREGWWCLYALAAGYAYQWSDIVGTPGFGWRGGLSTMPCWLSGCLPRRVVFAKLSPWVRPSFYALSDDDSRERFKKTKDRKVESFSSSEFSS